MGITKLKKVAKELGIKGLASMRARDKTRLIAMIRARTSPPQSPVRSRSPTPQRSPIRSRSPTPTPQRSPSVGSIRSGSGSMPSYIENPQDSAASPGSSRVSLSIPSASPISRAHSGPLTPDYSAGYPVYVPPSPPPFPYDPDNPSPVYHPQSPTREIQITPLKRREVVFDSVDIPSPDYYNQSPEKVELHSVARGIGQVSRTPSPVSRRRTPTPPPPTPPPPMRSRSPMRSPSERKTYSPPPRREGRQRVFPSDPPRMPTPPRSPAIRPTAGKAQVLSPREAHHIFTAPRIMTLQELQNVLSNMNVMEPEQSKSYVREDVERCLGLM